MVVSSFLVQEFDTNRALILASECMLEWYLAPPMLPTYISGEWLSSIMSICQDVMTERYTVYEYGLEVFEPATFHQTCYSHGHHALFSCEPAINLASRGRCNPYLPLSH